MQPLLQRQGYKNVPLHPLLIVSGHHVSGGDTAYCTILAHSCRGSGVRMEWGVVFAPREMLHTT